MTKQMKPKPAPLTAEQEAAMEKEYRNHDYVSTVENVNQWIDNAVYQYERHIAELESYREKFNQAVCKPDRFCKPTDALSWMMNSLNTPVANLRQDMLLVYATRLAENK